MLFGLIDYLLLGLTLLLTVIISFQDVNGCKLQKMEPEIDHCNVSGAAAYNRVRSIIKE